MFFCKKWKILFLRKVKDSFFAKREKFFFCEKFFVFTKKCKFLISQYKNGARIMGFLIEESNKSSPKRKKKIMKKKRLWHV